jgi:hypothetical protein
LTAKTSHGISIVITTFCPLPLLLPPLHQGVREAKKAAKRERREAERRAAVEELAAAAPLSPRNTAQRARERLRSDGGGGLSRGGSRGDWLMGSEDFEEAAGGGGGREASPAVPRGSGGNQELDDGSLLVDTLSSRCVGVL